MISKLYLLSWLVCVNVWLNVIIHFTNIFSWLWRQKKKLCNPESFWTPLSKKTKVKTHLRIKTSNAFNVYRLLQNYSISEISEPMYALLCISLSVFLQLSMESQQVLANLPEQSFLSASSSKDNILLFLFSLSALHHLLEIELLLFMCWLRPCTSCSTGSCRRTWCDRTQQVIKLWAKLTHRSRFEQSSVQCIHISIINV